MIVIYIKRRLLNSKLIGFLFSSFLLPFFQAIQSTQKNLPASAAKPSLSQRQKSWSAENISDLPSKASVHDVYTHPSTYSQLPAHGTRASLYYENNISSSNFVPVHSRSGEHPPRFEAAAFYPPPVFSAHLHSRSYSSNNIYLPKYRNDFYQTRGVGYVNSSGPSSLTHASIHNNSFFQYNPPNAPLHAPTSNPKNLQTDRKISSSRSSLSSAKQMRRPSSMISSNTSVPRFQIAASDSENTSDDSSPTSSTESYSDETDPLADNVPLAHALKHYNYNAVEKGSRPKPRRPASVQAVPHEFSNGHVLTSSSSTFLNHSRRSSSSSVISKDFHQQHRPFKPTSTSLGSSFTASSQETETAVGSKPMSALSRSSSIKNMSVPSRRMSASSLNPLHSQLQSTSTSRNSMILNDSSLKKENESFDPLMAESPIGSSIADDFAQSTINALNLIDAPLSKTSTDPLITKPNLSLNKKRRPSSVSGVPYALSSSSLCNNLNRHHHHHHHHHLYSAGKISALSPALDPRYVYPSVNPWLVPFAPYPAPPPPPPHLHHQNYIPNLHAHGHQIIPHRHPIVPSDSHLKGSNPSGLHIPNYSEGNRGLIQFSKEDVS